MPKPLPPADTSLESYERMAQASRLRTAVRKAIQRDGALTGREEMARGGPGCMTGDGNPRTDDTALCRDCRARPYGEIGEIVAGDSCSDCWTSHVVWLGNVWSKQPTAFCGNPLRCSHDCHRDEVWIA